MASKRPAASISILALSLALPIALSIALAGCGSYPAASGAGKNEIMFDDFNYADASALAASGWQIRSKAGHPGIEGARWAADGVQLVGDGDAGDRHALRLIATTDGTIEGTQQAQVCHARKYLEGTYAARIRFSDTPETGPDGDVVVQTFYAVSPLRFDFDPQYSEMDWEYLPNGGWGNPRTRMYSVTWQTVQLNPWQAFNAPHEEFRSLDGWHTLVMQAMDGKTHYFIDGVQVAEHGGRTYPAVPMAINFNLWFSPGGLLPNTSNARVRRTYREDVDWVFHARNRLLSPEQIEAEVNALRKAGTSRLDTVPSSGLVSGCDL